MTNVSFVTTPVIGQPMSGYIKVDMKRTHIFFVNPLYKKFFLMYASSQPPKDKKNNYIGAPSNPTNYINVNIARLFSKIIQIERGTC